MTGQRKFLDITRLDMLDRDSQFGAFHSLSIPITSIKEIADYTGSRMSIVDVWQAVQTRIEMKDKTVYYAKESRTELVKTIETPYV